MEKIKKKKSHHRLSSFFKVILISCPGMSVLKACSAISVGCKSPCLPLNREEAFPLGKNVGKNEQENDHDCKSLRVTLTLLSFIHIVLYLH